MDQMMACFCFKPPVAFQCPRSRAWFCDGDVGLLLLSALTNTKGPSTERASGLVQFPAIRPCLYSLITLVQVSCNLRQQDNFLKPPFTAKGPHPWPSFKQRAWLITYVKLFKSPLPGRRQISHSHCLLLSLESSGP